MIQKLRLRFQCWWLDVCYEHAEEVDHGECQTCRVYYSVDSKRKRLINQLNYARREGGNG